MWYRREKGVIVGGPYNCDQAFQVELLTEDIGEVMTFLNPLPGPPSTKEIAKAAVIADPSVPATVKAFLQTL